MDSSQLRELNEKESEFQSLVARIQSRESDKDKTEISQVFEIADQVLELKAF